MNENLVKPRVTQVDIIQGAVKPRHLEQGLAAVKFGVAADRPTDGSIYPIFFALDTGVLSAWNGSSWLDVTLS